MSDSAHFSVDTRLASLLGESYRSSEAAIKELVDNAWDADAKNVWIELPSAMSSEPVCVRDDGTGMTALELRSQYLNIASDKRKRTGERTLGLNRRVKGRKGIGKFAGLMIAQVMRVASVARGKKCTLTIDKNALLDRQDDLEKVELPFAEEAEASGLSGTAITLMELDAHLNFPIEERLREVLIYEYGREDNFKVFVNKQPLSLRDIPGPTRSTSVELPSGGPVALSFTVSDGKRQPRAPGIVLRVDGKTVGKPLLFGLDEDEEIPAKLARRVYGEVDVSGLEDYVTADWGSVIENSKRYIEVREYVRDIIKKELRRTYTQEMNLQKARLKRQIDLRLQKLPEHRRKYAEEALNRILKRFYGEAPERVETIAEVALDAMEHDAYWAVLERIGLSSEGDVGSFAESLKQFGLVDLATIGAQASHRHQFLDSFDKLIGNKDTLEKNAHEALEANLWVLGRKYATMSSNATLRSIVETYCGEKYKGTRASKRPDLLLSQDYGDSYLLIEFKRPSHPITREDIAQAEKYRDDLSAKLLSTAKMDIMMVGKGRAETVNMQHIATNIFIHSYASVISAARSELDWLIKSLSQR